MVGEVSHRKQFFCYHMLPRMSGMYTRTQLYMVYESDADCCVLFLFNTFQCCVCILYDYGDKCVGIIICRTSHDQSVYHALYIHFPY